MGSSISDLQATTVATVFGVAYLLLDALRFFMMQLGPVKLRRWSGEGNGNGWLAHKAHHFSLLTGAVLQVTLSIAVGFTIIAFQQHGIVRAAMLAIAFWAGISILWKLIFAFVPEEFGEKIVRLLLPLTGALYHLFWPLTFPLRLVLERVENKRDEDEDEEEVTDAEVQAYIDVGEEEGILEEGEGKLVQSIVDFGDRLAKELMTPRIDMLSFEANGTVDELARLFSESKYSRIPIYDQNVDRIVGVIHIKDLFDAHLRGESGNLRQIARRAYFVPETKKVAELLREFQFEHLQIAIVVDEYGGTSGLITIEDVMEAIVGDIADEHEDNEESIVEVDRDVFLVNGLVKIETLDDRFGVELSGDDYETVAGLIFTHTGRVPKPGEQVKKGGLVFEVERADKKRIYRVKVSRDAEVLTEPEAARGA